MARVMRKSGVDYLGLIPSDWKVTRGKHVLRLLQRSIRKDDGVVTCFRDGEVTLRANRRTDGFTVSLKEFGYQGIEPGDLVVHGMDGFAGAIGISDSRGKASPVLNVLDSSENKRYLMYYLRALAFREVYLALADGIRVRSCNLSWKKIGNLPIALPSSEEQLRIANYLDERCEIIGRSIAAAESSISDYKAWWQSTLYRTALCGIDATHELTNGPVDYLERVPVEWKTAKGKNVLRLLQRQINDDDGVVTCFRDGEVTLRTNRRTEGFTVALQEIGYQGINPGDLVVHGMDGFAGAIGVSDSRGKGSPVLIVLDSNENKKYLMYYLRAIAYREVFLALADGIRVRSCNLSWKKIANLIFVLPGYEEQLQIVEYLDKKKQQVDEAIRAKQAIINDLKAYKQSIIYEVVTGKREV